MKTKIIFLGNGPLAEHTLATFKQYPDDFDIIFHAKDKSDLATVKDLKLKYPEAYGILASFGVLIKSDLLDLFEPTGILNLHPSLLPQYRGPSPIETAILAGATEFSVSIMKLAKAMDAGPIYYQTTLRDFSNKYPAKSEIYQKLAQSGAEWLINHLGNLNTPQPQNDSEATFCAKFDTSMSPLHPEKQTALELFNQIRAFASFPKSKLQIFGLDCTIIKAHLATPEEANNLSASTKSTNHIIATKKLLAIQGQDHNFLVIDQIQPAGRKIMDAIAFKNGYQK